MSAKPQANRLLEIHKELMASNGRQVVSRLHLLNQSLKIFHSNVSDLKNAIDQHNKSNEFFDYDDTVKRDALNNELFEILRHLHNTVAAVLSLVDHTRAFYNECYKPSDLIPEYQDN